MRRLTGAILFLSLSLVAPALASADDDQGGHKKKHKPPPAAVEACKDKVVGDACTFEGRKGTVNGTCQARKKGDGLVCKRQKVKK